MGAFIAKQPNGLLCRFSTVVDCVTDYNMTEEEYIQLCMDKAAQDAKETIERYMRPFDDVKRLFFPNNMTEKEFEEILEEMSTPIELVENEDNNCINKELIKLAKKAADAWRNDSAYHQAAEIIDMLVSEIERNLK